MWRCFPGLLVQYHWTTASRYLPLGASLEMAILMGPMKANCISCLAPLPPIISQRWPSTRLSSWWGISDLVREVQKQDFWAGFDEIRTLHSTGVLSGLEFRYGDARMQGFLGALLGAFGAIPQLHRALAAQTTTDEGRRWRIHHEFTVNVLLNSTSDSHGCDL